MSSAIDAPTHCSGSFSKSTHNTAKLVSTPLNNITETHAQQNKQERGEKSKKISESLKCIMQLTDNEETESKKNVQQLKRPSAIQSKAKKLVQSHAVVSDVEDGEVSDE